MSSLTVNGKTASSASIRLRGSGNWVADVNLTEGEALTGAVTIASEDDVLVLKGTVKRSETFAGVTTLRIFGGKGGATKVLPARMFQNVAFRFILDASLKEAGESLAPSSDASVTSAFQTHWVRTQGTLAQCLLSIANATDSTVRVLDDGTYWIGKPSYPTAASAEFALQEWSPDIGYLRIAAQKPFLRPLTTLSLPLGTDKVSKKISTVEYNFEPAGLSIEAWIQDV